MGAGNATRTNAFQVAAVVPFPSWTTATIQRNWRPTTTLSRTTVGLRLAPRWERALVTATTMDTAPVAWFASSATTTKRFPVAAEMPNMELTTASSRPRTRPSPRPRNRPSPRPRTRPRPPLSPTERCDANNCMNWSCLDWCECYDEAQVSVYESHTECQVDNEESEAYGERHRKINYNQDAVDAGTAKMIKGTNVHVATKQHHMGGYHLTCGRHNPRECKEADKVTMNPNEKHEVRCCSDVAPTAALKKKH